MALADNLISYWKLDESSGDAADAVAGKTLANNNTTPFVAGKLNNAADLEQGSSQYFQRTNGGDFDPTSGSISVWVKKESNDGTDMIISTYTNAASGGFYLRVASTGIPNFGMGNGTNQISATTSLTIGTWFHIVVTWSPAGKKIYINGIAEGTSTTAETMTAGDGSGLSVGRDGKFSADYFDGLIDELGFWSRELTGDEVTALYNSGNGNQYPFTGAASTPLLALMGVGN